MRLPYQSNLQFSLELDMDVVRKILTRSMTYETLGRLLISGGLALGCFLGIHLLRESMDEQIAQQSNYLLIASTPMFNLPPATPLPTFTSTPLPTATPLPLPAIRLSIPAIGLNSNIVELSPAEKKFFGSDGNFSWEPAAFAVGHYDTSGNPGEGGNIVFAGHNNTLGEVFRDLNKLIPGDEIILFTNMEEFHYKVERKYLIPYLGVEKDGDAQLRSYAAPQSTEMVTLISCWPYATNSHRIVIIAVPVDGGE